ncbi:lysylphosphatidylglycerol synthase transmembrane domain-containing protein [Hymenobacter yonginensis]|uniref:Lysylphosphatidylglycerol synthase transmembrane domain-containing protein n=1 Tax=Hymenobacter yonginensis TaxID=748197 RepID=A0ABY7PRK6_9BACT|nr:lysylphosphatidylglycerol synthase transmembrane domain-containing protein [Hymenobacter yonginensis]WBO85486.1 lysylphosphatidylglycerol synthase transmembrane domain-containing protein [Hymenobacter yonginensis]
MPRHLQNYVQKPEKKPATATRRGQGLVVAGKLLITALTLGLLYHSVFADGATAAAWRGLLAATFTGAGRGPVLLALALVPVNWGVEAWKWWRLARHLELVSFRRSFRAVLVGLTLGFVTPNRVGDYAGRIIELKSRRLDALGAVFLGRYAQLVVTVLAGTAGLLYFLLRFYLRGYPASQLGAVVAAVLLNAAVLLPLYRSRLLLAVLMAVRPLQRFRRFLAVMPTYRAPAIHAVLALSGLRYAVFCAQFGLLLKAYGTQAALGPGAAAVAGTFLLKSLVPSLNALADVGVRELSATHLFGLLGEPALPVLSASLSLWILNIALPSATGLLFVLRLKVLRKRRKADSSAPTPPAA